MIVKKKLQTCSTNFRIDKNTSNTLITQKMYFKND